MQMLNSRFRKPVRRGGQESEFRMKTTQLLLNYFLFFFDIILTTVSCLLDSFGLRAKPALTSLFDFADFLFIAPFEDAGLQIFKAHCNLVVNVYHSVALLLYLGNI